MAKLLSQKEAEDKIKSKYDGEYILISKYTKMTDPATLIHLPCNSKIEVKRLKNFTNEGKCICRKCNPIKVSNSTKKVTLEEFKERVDEVLGRDYVYISGFTTMKNKCVMLHKVCNRTFESSPKMMLGVKQTRCPYCANNNRGKYALKEDYLNGLLKAANDGNEYEWLEDYKDNNKLMHSIRHIKCGNQYKVRPNDFQQGYRCPYCTNMRNSKNVLFIQELLKGRKITFKKEKKFKTCKDVLALPFDFLFKKSKSFNRV